MESSIEKESTCCLQKFNCCIIPFVATFICFGLFTLIIVASKLEDSAKNVPWKESALLGNAFRIDSLKIVIPILRRCDRLEMDIKFFSTSDNTKITDMPEIINSCGSSLSNWLNSSPTELILHFLNTASDDIHAIVMQQDTVHFSVIDSQNSNASEGKLPEFSVCILPENNNNQNDGIKISLKNIPEIAAFFESWAFYHASQFIVYDLDSLQNNSQIFEIYSNSNIVFPFAADKKIITDNFDDAKLFYIYDCLYRSQSSTQWTVITTFDEIPMIQTRSSLSNILSTISISMETKNLVYQISNVKSEEPTTMIFERKLINGFNEKLKPIFKDANGKITQIPIELVTTYSILQLNAELFQQANTSTMNQIFSSWTNQYNNKKQLYHSKFNKIQ